jgi:hypothetical protein
MKKLLTFLTLSIIAVSLSNSGLAAEPKTEAKPAAAGEAGKSAPKAVPFKGTVDSVDAAANSFTIKRKAGKVHTFKITPETVITKDDAPAKLTDVTAGEFVRGTRTKTGDNQWQVSKLMIGKKGTDEKADAGKTDEAPAADENM